MFCPFDLKKISRVTFCRAGKVILLFVLLLAFEVVFFFFFGTFNRMGEATMLTLKRNSIQLHYLSLPHDCIILVSIPFFFIARYLAI